MLVTYTAPNRAHHYAYAAALAQAGCLRAFVCGFSRFSPRAPLPELGARLLRADHVQNFYLASMRLRLPMAVSNELAYLSKILLDRMSEKPARESDVFLFYSGAGLRTSTRLQRTPTARVVEAVNTHVLVQQRILREEHHRLRLPFRRFHAREVARRVREYETADAILCPSGFVKDSFVAEGIPADRIFTVPYGFSLPTHGLGPQPQNDIFRVLYVGQLSVRKGLRYLLEAFGKLKHPRKELWIVGPSTKVTGLAGLRPPEGTRFLGVLKGDDLAHAYRSCQVFVLPTVEDGLGLVMGEALSFGLPVIATAHSGGADLFQDGTEGFIVPIRDPEAIAGKLQLLADDTPLLNRMSAAANARAQSLGGWEAAGRMLVEALASVRRVKP